MPATTRILQSFWPASSILSCPQVGFEEEPLDLRELSPHRSLDAVDVLDQSQRRLFFAHARLDREHDAIAQLQSDQVQNRAHLLARTDECANTRFHIGRSALAGDHALDLQAEQNG